MTSPFSLNRNGTIAFCLLALLAVMLLAMGCTQPVPQQQQQTPVLQQPQKAPAPVTVTQTDNSTLTITYPGSTTTDTLLELEVTVTDSAGNTQTKSIGSHLSTTPLKYGATLTLTGTFNGNNHVLVTGYFMDRSPRIMLDTTI